MPVAQRDSGLDAVYVYFTKQKVRLSCAWIHLEFSKHVVKVPINQYAHISKTEFHLAFGRLKSIMLGEALVEDAKHAMT